MSERTKRIPKGPMEAFGRVLQEYVRDRHENNQVRAGKALGISQGHVSAMITGTRGPGLNTLLLMRLETGKTIDEMLGFKAAPEGELIAQLVATFQLDVARLKRELADAKNELAKMRSDAVKAAAPAPTSDGPKRRKDGAK